MALTWLGAASLGWWLVLLVEQLTSPEIIWADILDAALLAIALSLRASVGIGVAHLVWFLTRSLRTRLRWLLMALATCALGVSSAREQAGLLTSGDGISQVEFVELIRIGLFVALIAGYVGAILWHLRACAADLSMRRRANLAWTAAGVIGLSLLVLLIRWHLAAYAYFAEHLVLFAWLTVSSLVYAGWGRSRASGGPAGTIAITVVATLGGVAWLRGGGGLTTGAHVLRQPLARSSFGALGRHEIGPRFDFTGLIPSECQRTGTPAPKANGDSKPPAGNVLLISVDTLRRDVLEAMVNGAPIAPNLSAFRSSAINARKANTTYPATILALTSAFTGLGPSEIIFAPRAQPSLFKLTRARFEDQIAIVPRSEWFTTPAMDRLVIQGTPTLRLPDAESQTDALLEHLDEARRLGRRTFAWIHYFEPHQPYERHPHHDFGGSIRASYASEVAALDEVIGRLLTTLRDRGWFDDTLIIVFSDHGEGLGEQGYVGHHVYLNSWMTDIPLYVHAPDVVPTTLDEAVDLRDVAATVLDFAGAPVPAGSHGKSLLARDWSPQGRRLVSEAFSFRGNELFAAVGRDVDSAEALVQRLRRAQSKRPSYDPKVAVTTARYRLIHNYVTGSDELYDRDADRSELHDVAREHQDVMEELRDFLRVWHREESRRIYCRFLGAAAAEH